MMKLTIPAILITVLCSCGSGDTRDGYPADTTGLNQNTEEYYNNNAPAGARGNIEAAADTTLHMDMNQPGPDTPVY